MQNTNFLPGKQINQLQMQVPYQQIM